MSVIFKSILLILIVNIVGCSQVDDQDAEPQSPLFKKITSRSSGFNFTNILAENENFNLFTWLYIYNGAGLATGDINNDGLVDIYMISNVGANKLFLNEGNMKFKDITNQSKTSAATGYKTGVTMVDINGDGWLDLYVCRDVFPDPKLRRNLVYINNKDLTFSEKGVELGLVDESYSTQALFLDIDQDNDLDIYLINHPANFDNATKIKSNRSRETQNDQTGNILFENVNGKFSNISRKAAVDFLGFGLSGIANDFNYDGLIDIYVANDFIEPDLLYINNGDKTFTESIGKYFSQMSQNSMGCDMADINNDGMLDLIITDMLAESNLRQKVFDTNMKINRYERLIENGYGKQLMRNSLFLANRDGLYSEIGQLAGVEKSDWSWSPIFSDVNLDGNIDLLITNGITRDMGDKDFIDFRTDSLQKAQKKGIKAWTNKTALKWLKMIPSTPVANHLYLSNGNLLFENMATLLGLEEKTLSQGAVFTDLDNDGDQDLIINNQGKPSQIYENTNDQNNFLKIQLKGHKGNSTGLGAKVKIFSNGKESIQLITANRGFLSSPDQTLHFGLKDENIVDSCIIYWPDGLIQLEKNKAWSKEITINYNERNEFIEQHEGTIHIIENKNKPFTFMHRENQFDDFKRQPLLINTNSKEGPALAKGRKETFLIGGAFGQYSEIYSPSGKQQLADSKDFEDIDALFFDIENDGSDELYVVSGGSKYKGKNPHYYDRLYTLDNNGKYQFTRQINTLYPGAVVTQADINNDNFTDLFVGSSHIPGDYPLSPYSYFLFNKNGNLSIVDSVKLGNVKDASFIDINGDELPDLIVVGEWMPVTVLINQGNGKFENETSTYGLDQTEGLWQSLFILNQEEGVSFAVGNYGLNTPYSVSETAPLTSYSLDFDGNESVESVITQYINGKEWPLARKEVITGILPSLKKNFLNNKSYALAPIEGLFGLEKVAKSEKYYVRELRSGVFSLNENNQFSFTPFDVTAQLSPINDFEYLDANDDGLKDLIFAAGMEYTEVEQGPMVALSLGIIIFGKENKFKNSAVNLLQGKAIKRIALLNSNEKVILLAENNGSFKSYNITW